MATMKTADEVIGYEAVCSKCGETFSPNDEEDLEHCVRKDGSVCGGKGELSGSWE